MSFTFCGAIVHPKHREVFPVVMEDILKQDDSQKNDCELNIAKWMSRMYKDQKWLVVEDVLYANGPHIEQITGEGWSYIVGMKPCSHKILFDLFEF